MKLVVLTSEKNRHKFFANYLAEKFDICGIVSEEKKPDQQGETKNDDEIIEEHFDKRKIAEEKYFGDHGKFKIDERLILRVKNGETNDPKVFEWIKSKNPDYIILFGTSIIKQPLLDYYDKRIINIHLGLSPYYRGSGTNFWPLVNCEPECVGATIHLAVLKVDAGSILAQIRPESDVNDRCHELGCKTIISGAKVMADCIEKYDRGEIIPRDQDLSIGRVYRRADFNAKAVKKMWNNFENNMMKEYCDNKISRDSKFPIVNL